MRAMILAAAIAVVLVPGGGQARGALKPGMTRDAYIRADAARAVRLAGRRFDRIDTGHKGMIDRPTYIHYYHARAVKLAGRRFERIDTNHDGTIEAAELTAWRAAHSHHRRHAAAAPARH